MNQRSNQSFRSDQKISQYYKTVQLNNMKNISEFLKENES